VKENRPAIKEIERRPGHAMSDEEAQRCHAMKEKEAQRCHAMKEKEAQRCHAMKEKEAQRSPEAPTCNRIGRASNHESATQATVLLPNQERAAPFVVPEPVAVVAGQRRETGGRALAAGGLPEPATKAKGGV